MRLKVLTNFPQVISVDMLIPFPVIQVISLRLLSIRGYSVMRADLVIRSRAKLDLLAGNSGLNILLREIKLKLTMI